MLCQLMSRLSLLLLLLLLLTSTGDRVFLNRLQLQKELDESTEPCIPILNTRVFFMSEWLRNRIG
jgi:hypothetical protein